MSALATVTLLAEASGAPTLDALVSDAWEGLAELRRVACPVCGGEMVAAHAPGGRPIEGRCRDCATTLS